MLLSLVGPGDVTAQDAVADLCTDFIGITQPRRSVLSRLGQEAAALPTRRPILAQQVRSAGLLEAAARAAAEFRPDVVHLEPGWTAEVAGALPASAPTVLATLDAWHLNWAAEAGQTAATGRRWRVKREAARMRRFEARMYAGCDEVVVVTEADAAELRRLDSRLRPAVVTNGVDAARFERPADVRREPDLVVVSGAMSYAPNIDAAVFAVTEVMPRLQDKRPAARLVVVGRDPAPDVRALAGPAVEVTGTVEDVRPYLWRAGAYLCPMRVGTGVKNKLLEALAAGAPCVVTPAAAAGLGLVDGEHALIRESADELAVAVASVLADVDLAGRLSTAGAARAGELSWTATAAGYEEVYQQAIARR